MTLDVTLENKKPRIYTISEVFRGLERIRTAVGAFAELSLATRPRDHQSLSVSGYVRLLTKHKTIKINCDCNGVKRKGD